MPPRHWTLLGVEYRLSSASFYQRVPVLATAVSARGWDMLHVMIANALVILLILLVEQGHSK